MATKVEGGKVTSGDEEATDAVAETPEEEAEAEAPAEKKTKKPKKEKPPPKQRVIRPAMADDKLQRIINFLKGSDHPVTYQEIMEQTDTLYDVSQFGLTALMLVGIVEKIGTMEGEGRSRIAWKWIGPSGAHD